MGQLGYTEQGILHASVGLLGICSFIQLINGIESWNEVSPQRRKLSSLMPESIAGSLKEKTEKGVASALEDLLLDVSPTD